MRHSLATILIFILVLTGCKSARDKVKEDFMPIARGEDDEMILVIDSAVHKGPVGEKVMDMFQQYVRILPQDERQFSINKVNPQRLNNTLKHVKNLVFVMTLDNRSSQSRTIQDFFTDNSLKMIQRDSSIYYSVRRDEFAKGQIVLYLFGQTEEQLLKKLNENSDQLVGLFEKAVEERIEQKLFQSTKSQLMKSVAEEHDFSIKIPYGYDLAKNLVDFVWLRKLEAESELNVFIHKRPYTSERVFNDIGVLRDDITQTYLRDSQKPELHIKRQEVIPVFSKRISYNGQFAVESRGLWAISDNSGGGPFISYTLVDEESQTLYYVEGYVYSPGTKKKDLLREVEAIISTFKLTQEEQAS